MYLRESTAQNIMFGPFLDDIDFRTVEPGLAITQANMQLSKDGATFNQKSAAGNATHDTDGWYQTALSATDTDTVGELQLQVDVAGALPVKKKWFVVTQENYDALLDSGADLVQLIWDELLTGVTHNVPASAGRRLRAIGSLVIREDTAQGSGIGTNQIQFDVGASAVDGAYDPAIVAIVSGSGAGQSRLILQYDGATKTATVGRDWKVLPDITSEFQILAEPGREHVNEGLLQAGTANTVTLNPLALAIDQTYNGQIIFIRGGTGADQARRVIEYEGATQIATVDKAWDIIPDSTSSYVMLPTGLNIPGAIVVT